MAIKDSYDYVIVGAGPAAAGAVKGIRDTDKMGSIAVFGSEDVPPLYRPDLSKTLWLEDGKTLEDSYLLGDEEVELYLETAVAAVSPGEHSVTLEDGASVGYGKLLLATGSEPRTFGLTTGPRVLTFRSAADYTALHKVATPGTNIVVAGGGYIGAELASALVQNDVSVTLVMPEDGVQKHMFPAELAAKITESFRSRGVEIVRGLVGGATETEDGVEVTLKDDDTVLEAHAIVAGLGVNPRTALAQDAGIEVDEDNRGVVVDEFLRTSVPDVFAAGDVASYPDALLGRRRVEHIDNAESMGETAGELMAGSQTPYKHTPFFWSDLFDDGYEAIGVLNSELVTITDWNDDRSTAVVYYVDDGHVVGVLLWNTWDSVPQAKELIAATKAAPVKDLDTLKGRIAVG